MMKLAETLSRQRDGAVRKVTALRLVTVLDFFTWPIFALPSSGCLAAIAWCFTTLLPCYLPFPFSSQLPDTRSFEGITLPLPAHSPYPPLSIINLFATQPQLNMLASLFALALSPVVLGATYPLAESWSGSNFL